MNTFELMVALQAKLEAEKRQSRYATFRAALTTAIVAIQVLRKYY